MGNIFKQLATKLIRKKSTLQATRMTVEKCENIHLHYRNMRLEFSEEEFNFFADQIKKSQEVLKQHPEETEFLPLMASLDLKENPEFFPDRISVEANVGSIHVHYKNLRLEYTPDEFSEFTESILAANNSFKDIRHEVIYLPLEDILVDDGGHRLDESHPDGFVCHNQTEHREQIDKIKLALEEGKFIRPIAVLDAGSRPFQRMDGFCRYIAHKELNQTSIRVILSKLAFAGCQDKKSAIITDEDEMYSILRGEIF